MIPHKETTMRTRTGMAVSFIAMMIGTGSMAQISTPPAASEKDVSASREVADAMIPVEPFGGLNVSIYPGDDEADAEYYFEVPGVGYIVGYPYTLDGEWVDLKPIGSPAQAASPDDVEADTVAVSEAGQSDLPPTIEEVIGDIQEWDSPEDKAIALDLILSLEKAETPEGMSQAVIDWRMRNSGSTLAQRGAEGLPEDVERAPEPSGIEEVLPNYPIAAPAELGSFRSVEGLEEGAAAAPEDLPATAEAEAPQEDAAAAEAEQEKTFAAFASEVYGRVDTEAFWFSAGSKDAQHVIYMMIDPECPYCADIITRMRPDIEAGKLQLRIVMTPILSAMSLDRAAEILTSEDPQQAVLDHAEDRISKGLIASETKFDSIPKPLQDMIGKNVEMFTDLKLPGVPVTSFKTADGHDLVVGNEEGRFWERAVR